MVHRSLACFLSGVRKQNARIEHDKALGRVVTERLVDHTELFKQFSTNPSFRKWLADTISASTKFRPGPEIFCRQVASEHHAMVRANGRMEAVTVVNRLREVFERVQHQPEDEQNYIAEMVQRELDDQTWERSENLRQALDASNADYAANEAMDFDAYDRLRRERETAKMSIVKVYPGALRWSPGTGFGSKRDELS